MKKFYSMMVITMMAWCAMGMMACSGGQKYDLTAKLKSLQEAEERYNKLDSAAQEKAYLADADTLFLDKKAGVTDAHMQGLCAQSDWAISLPQCEGEADGFLSKAQDLYNVNAAFNAIWSDFEIWARGQIAGGTLMDSTLIVRSIMSLKADCIQDKELRKVVSDYQKGIVWSIAHANELTEEKGPGIYAGELWDYMVKNYLNKKGNVAYVDTTEYGKVFDLDVDSVETAHYVKAWKNDKGWWKQMIEDEDFDHRIKLMLEAVHATKGGDRWQIEAMMALMQSGQYSPLLPRLWRTWRCCCQAYHCGFSRDSVIPNNLFNRYRKMVFTTIINHIIEHPDDKQAIACAQHVMLRTDMIRNGDCIVGSDCMLEMMDMGL